MSRSSAPRLRRSALLGMLVLPLSLVTAAASTVTLSIKNDDPQSLRCTIILAHWVTVDVGSIASGATSAIVMTRGPQPGALHIARFDGRPMMVENILCGTERDWGNSFDQLPLLPVRDDTGSTYQISCRAAPRVECMPSLDSMNDGKRPLSDDRRE